LDYLIPGLLGFLVGAAIYGLIYPSVFPAISAIANSGNIVLSTLLDVNVWLLIGLFVSVTLLLFYLIDRVGMQRKDKLTKPEA
jgi:uncharacterized protein